MGRRRWYSPLVGILIGFIIVLMVFNMTPVRKADEGGQHWSGELSPNVAEVLESYGEIPNQSGTMVRFHIVRGAGKTLKGSFIDVPESQTELVEDVSIVPDGYVVMKLLNVYRGRFRPVAFFYNPGPMTEHTPEFRIRIRQPEEEVIKPILS